MNDSDSKEMSNPIDKLSQQAKKKSKTPLCPRVFERALHVLKRALVGPSMLMPRLRHTLPYSSHPSYTPFLAYQTPFFTPHILPCIPRTSFIKAR